MNEDTEVTGETHLKPFYYTCVLRKVLSTLKLILHFATKGLTHDDANKTAKDKLKELQGLRYNYCEMFKNEIETIMLEQIQTLGITYNTHKIM